MHKVLCVCCVVVSALVGFFLSSQVAQLFTVSNAATVHPTIAVTSPPPSIKQISVASIAASPVLLPTVSFTITPTHLPTTMPTVPPQANGYIKIMPLGDSITNGDLVPGGYRTYLWNLLQGDGDKVDFVGLLSGGPSALGDGDHEGHIGWTILQLTGNVAGWIRANPPHIVLLHIGTNDLIAHGDAGTMTQNLSQLIGTIFAAKPDTYVVVSTIIPSGRDEDTTWVSYNASIPGIVAQYRNQGRRIVSVDMSHALTEGDLADGIHPSIAGYNKMAALWYPVVSTIYRELHPN